MNTCKLGNRSPALDAIVEDKIHELVIFLNSPWPSLQANFITTRLPSHFTYNFGERNTLEKDLRRTGHKGLHLNCPKGSYNPSKVSARSPRNINKEGCCLRGIHIIGWDYEKAIRDDGLKSMDAMQ